MMAEQSEGGPVSPLKDKVINETSTPDTDEHEATSLGVEESRPNSSSSVNRTPEAADDQTVAVTTSNRDGRPPKFYSLKDRLEYLARTFISSYRPSRTSTKQDGDDKTPMMQQWTSKEREEIVRRLTSKVRSMLLMENIRKLNDESFKILKQGGHSSSSAVAPYHRFNPNGKDYVLKTFYADYYKHGVGMEQAIRQHGEKDLLNNSNFAPSLGAHEDFKKLPPRPVVDKSGDDDGMNLCPKFTLTKQDQLECVEHQQTLVEEMILRSDLLAKLIGNSEEEGEENELENKKKNKKRGFQQVEHRIPRQLADDKYDGFVFYTPKIYINETGGLLPRAELKFEDEIVVRWPKPDPDDGLPTKKQKVEFFGEKLKRKRYTSNFYAESGTGSSVSVHSFKKTPSTKSASVPPENSSPQTTTTSESRRNVARQRVSSTDANSESVITCAEAVVKGRKKPLSWEGRKKFKMRKADPSKRKSSQSKAAPSQNETTEVSSSEEAGTSSTLKADPPPKINLPPNVIITKEVRIILEKLDPEVLRKSKTSSVKNTSERAQITKPAQDVVGPTNGLKPNKDRSLPEPTGPTNGLKPKKVRSLPELTQYSERNGSTRSLIPDKVRNLAKPIQHPEPTQSFNLGPPRRLDLTKLIFAKKKISLQDLERVASPLEEAGSPLAGLAHQRRQTISRTRAPAPHLSPPRPVNPRPRSIRSPPRPILVRSPPRPISVRSPPRPLLARSDPSLSLSSRSPPRPEYRVLRRPLEREYEEPRRTTPPRRTFSPDASTSPLQVATDPRTVPAPSLFSQPEEDDVSTPESTFSPERPSSPEDALPPEMPSSPQEEEVVAKTTTSIPSSSADERKGDDDDEDDDGFDIFADGDADDLMKGLGDVQTTRYRKLY